MPRVTLMPGRLTHEVPVETNLMEAIRSAGRPLGSACGGEGICSRCRVIILDGGENLSPPGALEQRVAAMQRLAADERVSCLATVQGDIVITVSSWGSS